MNVIKPVRLLLLALALLFAAACSGGNPEAGPPTTPAAAPTAPPNLEATVQAAVAAAIHTPTPDIEATVQARLAAVLPTPTPVPTPDIEATVQARLADAMATAAPEPTPTPAPNATPAPAPDETTAPLVAPRPFLLSPGQTLAPDKSSRASLSEIVKEARPAVVRIESGAGTGTGVIFETRGQTGYIVTNHHVVEGYEQVKVVVNDTMNYRGMVQGTDEVRDLAVVSICCGEFQILPFGDASGLEPGDEVMTMGYAMGLSGMATVTRGIVSAIRYDPRYLSDVIQTDASINPGNSGGPMLSMDCEVLGINTFRMDESNTGRAAEGLGFAVSEKTVQGQIPMLRANDSRPADTLATGPSGDFGPLDGELRHSPDNAFIETQFAGVAMADMVVEATFVNPYSAAFALWDYGFTLRKNRNDPFINIVVASDMSWSVIIRDRTPGHEEISGGGSLWNLDTSDGGRNRLRVVAVGERGWLFVNGEFISSFALPEEIRTGDVAVITGAYGGSELAGAVTRFEDFQGGRLTRSYGPASGKLQKEPGLISEHDSGVQTRDLVTEAEFINPQGSDWSYGFVIRNPVSNRLEVIGITDKEQWFHKTRDIDDDGYVEAAGGSLSAAGVDFRNRNRLLLFAFERTGWLFLNGRLVAWLDLSHNLDSGWISVMGDFYLMHHGSPEFENFSVWTP